jgi:hypothetical protein
VARPVEIDGAAHLVLTDGVVPLHPQEAVFDAMLLGWRRQQRSRLLSPGTVENRDSIVKRFHEHVSVAVEPVGCGGLDQSSVVGYAPVGALHDPQLPEPAGHVLLVSDRPTLRMDRAVRAAVRRASRADLHRVERRQPQRPV